MIKLADKFHCTGCSACANSCAHQAIMMASDEEGFLQPVINQEKCVECGLCTKHCSVLNPVKVELIKQTAYAVISNKDRTVSSSGGAFSVFARYILSQEGVVFGATIDKKFKVKHIAIQTFEGLSKLRGSKYVQSEIGDSYKQVKIYLSQQRKVLFVGTPCQVAGLYAYLNGKRYENLLITLDLVCHGVPSQGAFDAYIGKLKKIPRFSDRNIEKFRFRKFDSWSIIPAVKLAKSEWKILNLWENAYMNAFFRGYIFRESCFRCQHCNTNRVGTFTIADFWGIGRHGVSFKKSVACGVSLVIDNQNNMPSLLNIISKDAYIERRTIEEAVVDQTNLREPLIRHHIRDKAISMLMDSNTSLQDFSMACGLPCAVTPKYVMMKLVKDSIVAFGLYNVYKTLIYKLGK